MAQKMDSNIPPSHPAFKIGKTNKARCDYPGYLFWKLQSQLTKLNFRLTRSKHIKADQKLNP